MNLKQRKNKNFLQHAHEMFRHTFSYMKKKRLSNVYHKRHHFSLSIQDDKWARVKYSKEKQKLTEI